MPNPLAADLDHILAHTAEVWPALRGARIFITGGTGFFGCWLLESFAWANDRLRLGAKAVVLSRDAAAFRQKAPHLAGHPAIQFHAGDVRTFDFLPGRFSHVIHAATDSSTGLSERDPLDMFDSIVTGTRHVLDFAVIAGARRFLLTSSGAVYGKQPPEMTHVPETHLGAPNTMDPRSAYAEGKRAAELLCAIYHQRHGLETTIARGFAFVGPYLPLDVHFAIGNFIRDRLTGGPIRVQGDGTPYRSYLYAADLAIWLWTILLRGRPCFPYNVGSDHDLTIAQVAQVVAESGVGVSSGRTPVHVALQPKPDAPAQRYVPDVHRAPTELRLVEPIALPDAVEKTIAWASRQAADSPRAESMPGQIDVRELAAHHGVRRKQCGLQIT